MYSPFKTVKKAMKMMVCIESEHVRSHVNTYYDYNLTQYILYISSQK